MDEKNKGNKAEDAEQAKELEIEELDSVVGGTEVSGRRRDDLEMDTAPAEAEDGAMEHGAFTGYGMDVDAQRAAIPMSPDGHSEGRLNSSINEPNFHSVLLEPGATYTFDTSGSRFDTQLALLDSDGNILVENDDLSPTDRQSQLSFTVPEDGGGLYYVGVSSYMHGYGPTYSLNMDPSPAQTSLEEEAVTVDTTNPPPDSVVVQPDADLDQWPFRSFQQDVGTEQNVTPMPPENQLQATLDPEAGDANYHSVSLEPGSTYTFDTFGSGFDTTMVLFDAEGNALATNDDTGSERESQIKYTVPADGGGSYILGVASYDGLEGEVYQYNLNMDASEYAFETEAGQTLALQIDVPQYESSVATVVSGLPAGVYLGGLVQPPVLGEDGRLFQAVDAAALRAGDINLHIPPGFFGEIELSVTTYTGTADELEPHESTYKVGVAPTDEALVYAAAGELSFALGQDEVTIAQDSDIDNSTMASFQNDMGTTQVAQAMVGGEVAANLDPELGDANYHSLILEAGQTYQFDTRGSSFDTTLALFDAEGTALVANDDVEGGQGERSSAITYTVPEGGGGTYVLGVGSYAGGADSGAYVLHADPAPATPQQPVPLDLVVNPLVAGQATVAISGIPEGAGLLNAAGEALARDDDGSYRLNGTEVRGLRVDLGAASADFDIAISTTGSFDDEAFAVDNTVHIEVANLEIAPNGDSLARMEGNRGDYQVERVGNTLEVSHNTNPDDVTRFALNSVDHIRFADGGFISSADFVRQVDVSGVVDAIAAQGNDLENTLVVVNNLAVGAVLDNAVQVAENTFAIPASEIVDGALSIDLPLVDAEAETQLEVRAYVMTEGQAEFFNGAGRIEGSASAEVSASAEAGASFELGPDGLRAEARVAAEARAVASAGGSLQMGVLSASGEVSAEASASAEAGASFEVGPDGLDARVGASAEVRAEVGASGSVQVGEVELSGEVSAEAHASAEVDAGLYAGRTGVAVDAYVGTEAVSSVTGSLEIDAGYVPGTSYGGEGVVAVRSYAFAGGETDLNVDDGNIRAGGGAEAGITATADGEVSGSVAGFGGTIGGGVSAGLAVGASGAVEAGFEDGVLSFGLEGELTLLLGVEFDISFEIDTNAVVETAEMVADGVVTAYDAVSEGLMPLVEAIDEGLMELSEAVASELITAATAINQGFIDAEQAIRSGLMEATDAVRDGFIAATAAVEEGLITGYTVVSEGLVDAATAVRDGIMDATAAVNAGFMQATDAVRNGFIEVADAVEDGLITGYNAVSQGLVDATTAVQNGIMDASSAIASGFIEVADAVEDGLISAASAVNQGLVDATKAVQDGIIDATAAVEQGLITATNAVNQGLMTATAAVEDGLITATNAVNQGLMTAATAVEDGLITVTNAVNQGLIDAADAVEEGLLSAENAINQGLLEATAAIDAGLITVEQAINDFGQDAEALLSQGYQEAGNFLNDVGAGIEAAAEEAWHAVSDW